MEKFKLYKELMIHYLTNRFSLARYAILALLLVLMGRNYAFSIRDFAEDYLFVFLTLFVFRWIDDAGSFYFDRKEHPDRRYLEPAKFRHFVLFTILIVLAYITGIFFFSVYLGWTILILTALSIILYLLFFRVKQLMILIPLLKYPVIIWSILGFSLHPAVIFISIAAFIMMLIPDLFAEKEMVFKRTVLKASLLLITGLLVLHPWNEIPLYTDIILLAVMVLVPCIRPFSRWKFTAVILIPLMHILDLIIRI